MTNEEALNRFKWKYSLTKDYNDPHWEGGERREHSEWVEQLEIAIKALERQIPKKPIRANRAVEKDGQLFMNDDNEYWKCPICTDYDVPLRENQQYCHYCGQKIDWSDTE